MPVDGAAGSLDCFARSTLNCRPWEEAALPLALDTGALTPATLEGGAFPAALEGGASCAALEAGASTPAAALDAGAFPAPTLLEGALARFWNKACC